MSKEETTATIEKSAEDQARENVSGKPHDDRKEIGRRGEEAACNFLMRNGYDILERNWTCPAGEVDIIAATTCSLHFVEVKTRRGTGRGFPEEAVDAEKRQRYERIAECYLSQYEETDISIHFDIIGILVNAPDRAFLRFHKDAFCKDC